MTSPAPLIAVVGSLHYDILVAGDARPRKGETLFGESWAWKCGGKGGNQALEAARHGGRVAFIGAVGRDGFGDALLNRLSAAGISTESVRRLADVGSGMSVALFDRSGDYGAVIVPGSNWQIAADDLAEDQRLRGCDALLLQNEVRPEINLAAAMIAKKSGALVILNAAPARELPDDLASLIDILVVNEIEAEALSDDGPVTTLDAAEAAARTLTSRVATVIITLGGEGLVACRRGEAPVRVCGHHVPVASTHGAGDTLIGALATRLVAGADLASAARYANAAAALLVSTPEADRAGLTAGDTMDFLETAGPA
ncbi:MAG: ribokinase [Pseudomonadota bacterium]